MTAATEPQTITFSPTAGYLNRDGWAERAVDSIMLEMACRITRLMQEETR